MSVALEAHDYTQTASIGKGLRPELVPAANRLADYRRAPARLRGRQDDAVRALRRAERISPGRVQRHPFTRDVTAELLARSSRDVAGRELRGTACRTGLPL